MALPLHRSALTRPQPRLPRRRAGGCRFGCWYDWHKNSGCDVLKAVCVCGWEAHHPVRDPGVRENKQGIINATQTLPRPAARSWPRSPATAAPGVPRRPLFGGRVLLVCMDLSGLRRMSHELRARPALQDFRGELRVEAKPSFSGQAVHFAARDTAVREARGRPRWAAQDLAACPGIWERDSGVRDSGSMSAPRLEGATSGCLTRCFSSPKRGRDAHGRPRRVKPQRGGAGQLRGRKAASGLIRTRLPPTGCLRLSVTSSSAPASVPVKRG